MLFLRSWLEEYINLEAVDNHTLQNLITNKIAEVDDVLTVTDYFNSKVVIGKIENVHDHPEADKLKIFQVNIGQNQPKPTIVSAAPNVKSDLIIPVALVGTKLPYMSINPRKLRGVESSGMCCGKSELMLEKESPGLWELESEFESDQLVLGNSICSLVDSNKQNLFNEETIFDIKVLPDKMPLIGNHLGMALEISIALEEHGRLTDTAKKLLDTDFINQEFQKIQTSQNLQSQVEFDSQSPNYSNIFNLYEIELNQDFILPVEYQKRMFLTQRNLVNSIADLSNYLLADIGQPSHFFNISA